MSEAEIKAYLAEIGRKGGQSARGEKKARTPEQARKAALAMWAKRRKKNRSKNTPKEQK